MPKLAPELPGTASGSFHEFATGIEPQVSAEMAESVCLRKEWMQIIGYTIEEIEESIRETPPTDVLVEHNRLDGAKRMMAKPDLSASDFAQSSNQ